MVRILLFITILSCSTSLSAQKKDMVFPNFRIGITPSALLNINPAIQISWDKKINKIVNFSLETGYIYNSLEGGQGLRVRPGIEVFIARSPWVSFVSGLHYNYRRVIDFNERRTLATNGEFEFIQYNAKNDLALGGVNVENKLMFKLSARSYLDLGGGLGLGTIRRRSDAADLGVSTPIDLGDFNVDLIIPGLIFYTHLNFSYAIGK